MDDINQRHAHKRNVQKLRPSTSGEGACLTSHGCGWALRLGSLEPGSSCNHYVFMVDIADLGLYS